MSINIGYLGNNYGTNNIGSMDNRLVINTYNTSNSININTNPNSTSNAVINYKNLYKTGVIDNNYVIQNSSNDNAFILSNSNININKNTNFNNDISCKLQLNTSNDTFNITSNINIYLYKNNNFSCYDKDINNPNFIFNNNFFKIYKDTYFEENLYVNSIKPTTTTGLINIYNANLIGAKIESTDVIRFSINGEKAVPITGQSFIINRYYNSSNILEVNSINFNENTSSNTYYNEPIFKHFALDNNGMVSIGSKPPDAPLSISANYYDNPYIFKYTGTQLSDTFNISKDANVGIGTTNPMGILHINRNDDKYDYTTSNLSYNSVRNLPLIKLNIDYDITKNIITSSNNDIIINSSNIIALNTYSYSYIPINIEKEIFNNTSQLVNNIYILNNELNNIINNDITNLSSNIIYKTYTLNNFISSNLFKYKIANTYINFNYKNNIYYPNNTYLLDYIEDNYYSILYNNIIYDNIYRYKSIHTYNHGIIILSKDTYNEGKYNTPSYFKNNINNFTKSTSNFFISTLTYSNEDVNGSNINLYDDVNFNLNIYIEKNKIHKTSYITSNIIIPSPAPDFLYLTSNNEYKASISHNGTLSLGTKCPLNKNNYILYIPEKTGYINNIETNSITTSNSSIIFNNKNISSINNITSLSTNITNGIIDNIYSSNIIIYNQLSIKNITMNSSNVHLTNKLSISSDPLDTNSILRDQSALMKITLTSNILIEDSIFKNTNGIVITNNNIDTVLSSNINPSISIYGKDGSYPLIKLSKNNIINSSGTYTVDNTLNNYFIRLATKTYYNGGISYLDHFEICCDNIRDTPNKTSYYNDINTKRKDTNILPSFIKHVKDFNMLCFGELNNICIKCDNAFSDIYSVLQTEPKLDTFTNSTNKISLGIPFKDKLAFANNNQNDFEDWVEIFNNKICKAPKNISDVVFYNKYNSNMLNIFGNTGIWSISGNNILKTKMNVDNSYNDIGCEIVIGNDNNLLNANTNLNVYGGIISVYPIKTYASENIMNGIVDINSLYGSVEIVNKIKNIKGYSYYRNNPTIREFGLKAEEVQEQFPQLISEHNDKLTIQYGNMTAVLVEAIKELSDKLDAINTRLTNIEASI
mgnify:CR=1 FL=1|uniref:Peptidase S74 domain-containing protein n=1 Tax=viral metagenome TaxID=1070528 RepID=A0A6C0J5Y3_9ZZZZ